MKTIVILCCLVSFPLICKAEYNILETMAQDLESSTPFQSPDSIPKLRSFMESEDSTDEECTTAKITLVLYLLDRDTTNMEKHDLMEPFELCRQIIKDNTGTWQAEMARFFLVLEATDFGDAEDRLVSIEKGLSEINFSLLDNTDHTILKAMARVYSCSNVGWKEPILLMKGFALCDLDHLAEAKDVLNNINSKHFSDILQDQIELRLEMKKKQDCSNNDQIESQALRLDAVHQASSPTCRSYSVQESTGSVNTNTTMAEQHPATNSPSAYVEKSKSLEEKSKQHPAWLIVLIIFGAAFLITFPFVGRARGRSTG